jgi:hypothetical protein
MISMNCRPPWRQRRSQSRRVACGECADPEQAQLNHRLGNAGFDEHERRQQDEARGECSEHERATERDDQDRLHQPVAHDHPQQVGDASRGQRIEVDATKSRAAR